MTDLVTATGMIGREEVGWAPPPQRCENDVRDL